MLRDISHPRQRLIPTLLHDLQIPHLDATHGEIRNFELDSDGCALVVYLGVTFHGRETEMRAHEEFAPAAELFNFPDKGGFIGGVGHGAG